MPEKCVVTDDSHAGIWAWVLENNIPIIITEGAKKAGRCSRLGVRRSLYLD